MRQFHLVLIIIIIFSLNIFQTHSNGDFGTEQFEEKDFSIKFSKDNVQQTNITASSFNGSVTIIFSTSLYWLTIRQVSSFIDQINNSIAVLYPNITLAVDFSPPEELFLTNYVQALNNASEAQLFNRSIFPSFGILRNTSNYQKDYLISIGRSQQISVDNKNIQEIWTNQTAYNESAFKTVAFIDSNIKNLENVSYQNYNLLEGGFLSGVWAAFASKNHLAGVITSLGPEIGYSSFSAFTVMNSELISGLFSGIEYIREDYLNRDVFPVYTKSLDQSQLLRDENEAKSENKLKTNKLISEGVDTFIGLGNIGDEGILEAVNNDDNHPVILINSYPVNGYNNAAFLYPNYTLAVLKQIEFWANHNRTNQNEYLQETYHPNTPEYPFLNTLDRMVNHTQFLNISSEIINSKIFIPYNYLICYGGNCHPPRVQIVSGYTMIILFATLPLIIIFEKGRKQK